MPRFATLVRAFEAKRIAVDPTAPVQNPELVLVLEIVGSVQNFYNAVSKIPQLEWLLELAEDHIEPDNDFYLEEAGEEGEPISGQLYLLGSNEEALRQLLSLWERYKADPMGTFDKGLAPFKHAFAHLKEIRPWDARDRISDDVRLYWQNEVERGDERIRFEVEAWCFPTQAKNEASAQEITSAIQTLNGRVLQRALIEEIAYHGFLVELPAIAVRSILAGDYPALILSDRIMFFRPRTQSIADGTPATETTAAPVVAAATDEPPVVAVLDGLPLANHTLLQNRILIDDPDGWGSTYEVKDRVHATGMASLILHGDLNDPQETLRRRLYVRPIMRPDPADPGDRRIEQTPDDVLLIDLVHRAVKRICEGDAQEGPAAPTVRVINLSVGLSSRVFAREISPWARLLDWLAHRYSVLFIVSAGNDASPLSLATQRDVLPTLAPEDRQKLAFSALVSDSTTRRLLAPSESINALTVGAFHADSSQPNIPYSRYDLFALNGISPYSRIGHGHRRSIKPDVLFPGGRALYSQRLATPPNQCVVDVVHSSVAPGHRVATPPTSGGGGLAETTHSRGTSNATALASRAAAQAYDVVESLRHQHGADLPARYDAALLKAMLVHGAQWGDDIPQRLLAERPDFANIAHGASRRMAERDFVARWLGYGMVDVNRGLTCMPHRATLIGVGDLRRDEAQEFIAPLPPGLSGVVEWRRITVTLAWMSPVRPTLQRYRQAKLWIKPPDDTFQVFRASTVNDRAALRGTVQHEVLEGTAALAFVDGDNFSCKVNCMADAAKFEEEVSFALLVSVEVAVGSGINVYQQIRDRIAPAVRVGAP